MTKKRCLKLIMSYLCSSKGGAEEFSVEPDGTFYDYKYSEDE